MDFDPDKDYGQPMPEGHPADAWDAVDLDEPAITAPDEAELEAAQSLDETEEAYTPSPATVALRTEVIYTPEQSQLSEDWVDNDTSGSAEETTAPPKSDTVDGQVAESPEPESHPSGEFLGFRQKFDGTQPEVPPREQALVAFTFEHYVKSALNNTEVGETPYYNPETDSWVDGHRYSFDAQIDGKDASITLQQVDREYPDTMVDITELQEGHPAGETATYKLRSDGIVKRNDWSRPPLVEQQLTGIDPRAPMSGQEATQILIDSLHASQASVAGFELEADLGMNNQPIGQTELQQLRQLIDRELMRHLAERDSQNS